MENYNSHETYQPVPVQPRVSGAVIVPSILSLAFAVVALLTGILNYISDVMATLYDVPHIVALIAIPVTRILFCIPALILGIIGLIKNIRAKRILGIIFAAAGLALCLIVVIIASISISRLFAFYNIF